MKKYSFVSILAALCLVAACTDQPDIVIRPGQEMVLTARTEQPASKTVVTNETHVYWEPGDEIAIFSGDKSGKFTTDLSAASATATFKGSLGGDPDETLWAVYPYSDKATFDGESITTVLPSVQTARAGSFGKDMNLAVAQTTGSTLQFYNVGGGVRFSVKEEGIKKVMFEGLNGEILAGTVKIGFENSMPVVKEVTSGSQFLTLLPPEGETFQKDTWYYIVALPAALEKGYKLRFYKTDDYARRVSENAVTISRSLYGSVAGADEGLAYEAISTSFPETKEDINTSIDISNDIFDNIDAFVEGKVIEDEDDIESLAEEIRNIDNVLNVYVNSTGTGLIIQQKDSVFFNYSLMDFNGVLGNSESPFQSEPVVSQIETKSNTSRKKAILLCPAESNLEDREYMNKVCASLDYADIDYNGYRFYNGNANVLLFRGDILKQFDLVYIVAHGAVGGTTRMRDGKYAKDKEVFQYMTGTSFSKDVADKLVDEGKLSWDQISYVGTIMGRYFTATPDFLNNTSFNYSCVISTSCHSAQEIEGYSYMLHKFLSVGAGVFSGYSNTISTAVGPFIDGRVIDFLCHGISFQDAADYWKENSVTFSQSKANYWRQKGVSSNYSNILACDYHRYKYEMHPSFVNKPYYLTDDHKIDLHEPVPGEANSYSFSWDCGLRDFTITDKFNNYIGTVWEKYEPYEKIHEYTVQYDVYLDKDDLLQSKTQNKTAFCSELSSGEHSWYVVANIVEEGIVIASYKSEVGTFTVKEATYETPSLIDLGMPSGVKWASFNLGATKPEEYGRYFAWGETTPKSNYDWSNYKWCKGSNTTITKYCWNGSYGYNGFVDNKRQLDLSDDAANAQLKGEFRTPTCDDWKELLEHTTHQWTNNYNGTGVAGLVCKSTVSGYTTKQIFLPAARYGSCGDYMTSSAVNTNPDGFDVVYFTENQLYGANYDNKCSAGSREEGYTIRPVYGQPVTPSVVHSVTVSPASYNFGSVVAGQQSDSKKFSITNGGSEDIEYWVESCPDGFAYPDGMKNKVRGKVSANSTLERFWVRFVPTQAKNYSGTVVLGTTDSEYPYLYISVSGKGTN